MAPIQAELFFGLRYLNDNVFGRGLPASILPPANFSLLHSLRLSDYIVHYGRNIVLNEHPVAIPLHAPVVLAERRLTQFITRVLQAFFPEIFRLCIDTPGEDCRMS